MAKSKTRTAKAKARAKKRPTKKTPPKKTPPKKTPPKKTPPKKTPATKTPPKKTPATKPPPANKLPATAAPSAAAPPAYDWRAALRAAVEATGEDFAGYLRGLGANGWEHADTPELAGLEQWGTELATRDRLAGIGALVRVAQHGVRIAIAAGGIGLEGMGFLASEPSADGAPVETQIARAAAWLDAPDAAHLAAVAAANDPSRQLQVWDEDLRPSDDAAHWWYMDVGQCCGHAITRTGGDPRKSSYYDWGPETCVGRGLVAAVRGLRSKGSAIGGLLSEVRAAMIREPA